MCGVIGSYHLFGAAEAVPLRSIAHRGPDAHGSWLSSDKCCWLGHTRLSIQDLSSAGSQPITSACGRITLSFNGELYNHISIRSKLSLSNWRGHSDSETLVEALAEHGPEFLDQFIGMFAFAAYDNHNSQLILARDRLGIKPLYMCSTTTTLFFASESKSLPFQNAITSQELSSILSFGHCSTPAYLPPRLFENRSAYSLPVAQYHIISAEHGLSSYCYWPRSIHIFKRSSLAKQIDSPHVQLRRLLSDVVHQHLLSDTPVACFLSSGLDSGILAALANSLSSVPISTFTVRFFEPSFDEGPSARMLSEHLGTSHHEVCISEDTCLELVEKALCSLDLPSADALNTFIISQAISEYGFKVAISGLGADELFGGYPSHQLSTLFKLISFLPSSIRLPFLSVFSPPLARKLDDLPSWSAFYFALALRRWLNDKDLHQAHLPPLIWPEPHLNPPSNIWGMTSWAELFGYTEPMLLRDADVMSMANSLEIRVPFLDHRLVEFALALPACCQSLNKGFLRSTFADLFPPLYLRRRKKGFALPMDSWMRGPLHHLSIQRISWLCDSGWLDSSWIQLQWSKFSSHQIKWTVAWSLVVLGEFARRSKSSSVS